MTLRIEVSEDKPSLVKNLQTLNTNHLHLGDEGCLRDDAERALLSVTGRRAFPYYRFVLAKKRTKRQYYVCSIAFVEEQPVAALYLENFHIQFFTKPEFRKQGLARKLLEATKEKHDLSVKLINYVDEEPSGKSVMRQLGIPTNYRDMRKIHLQTSLRLLSNSSC